jgi:hypothetical protein
VKAGTADGGGNFIKGWIMNATFKYDLEQKITTPFGEAGIVKMCAVDEVGIQYYVKTAGGGNWFKEAELVG